MKIYPLEIVALYDPQCDELRCWVSKGHHDPVVFLAAVREHESGDSLQDEGNPVRHEYRRIAWGTFDGERKSYWDTVAGPARGAFPATVIYR